MSLESRRLIDDAVIARVAGIVDRSPIAANLGGWRNDDRINGLGGRPAALDDRAVLILFLLLAVEDTPLFVSEVARAIESRLSDYALDVIGARQHAADGEDWYDRRWRAVRRLLDVVDPYPAPRRRLLSDEERRRLVADRDPAVQSVRELRLNWLANQIVELSWQYLPRDVRRRWKGNVAVDDTPVAVFAKPSTARRPWTVEPDAGWNRREGDHDGGDGPKGGRKHDKWLWGWEATLVIATPNDPARPADFPLLTTGIAFDVPGKRVAKNGMIVFASMYDRDMPVGLAAGDRAYWSTSDVRKWQLPMRALGWHNINDYKTTELGVQHGNGGAVLVEGAWYCPSMPQPLVEATIDFRVRKAIDEPTWRQRIAERGKYELHAKEHADGDGHQPLRCPAVGPSATVACPLRKNSLVGTNVHLRPRVTPPAVPDRDRICTQSSVSFPPKAGAKYRQDVRFGTAEWDAAYHVARNTIEGFNGYIKDGAHEALGDTSRRRLRGRATNHLLTSLLVAAANFRRIAAFHAEQDSPTRVTQIDRARRRRRRESLRDYLPDANAPPAPTGTES